MILKYIYGIGRKVVLNITSCAVFSVYTYNVIRMEVNVGGREVF